MITPLMAAVFVVVFVVMWRRGRMDTYVLAFALAYFSLGTGFIATHIVPDTSAPYVFHLTQFFYSIGVMAVVWGATRRVGHTVPIPWLLGVYAISAVTLGAAVLSSQDTDPRLFIVNSGYGVMFLIGTLALITSPRREAIDKLVIALFVLSAVQFFVRPPLTMLSEGLVNAGEYRESIYYSVLNVAVTIQSLMTAVTLIGACAWDQMRTMRDASELDHLTGLRMRRAFEQEVIAALDKASREDVPVGLIIADIDNFKSVNDVYGHQRGDRAIAGFGTVIADMIRETDIAGRVGGEEFCILAWNCDGDSLSAMAERIRAKFASTAVDGMPSEQRLTASFGTSARREGEGYGKLFARCDAALYRAKNAGRNRVESVEADKSAIAVVLGGADRRANA
ncbi:GGDEF domain-containing protein [Qipengyuania marisflavi]|nr:GGDEF domain-containing protein [Qipengyuania marisflavi]